MIAGLLWSCLPYTRKIKRHTVASSNHNHYLYFLVDIISKNHVKLFALDGWVAKIFDTHHIFECRFPMEQMLCMCIE